ncbi:hypothetical protein [Flavobacterium humi]|uniref:DUF4352 domain-containing protein n=1 Tax=Flavobacterium humi TaxID=2562683 RepID=A0A4Z0L8Y9_9FLAO|nr:hypothetical protein [Flavobacterium humi]TGD58479.1 hypothetical protein E4635_06080 [Flavobacterium humi]
MKAILSGFLFLMLTGFAVLENNVEGLTVTFRKISEDYIILESIPNSMRPSYVYSNMIEANENMMFVKMKLIFKNEGTKDCVFNMDDVYISTPQDSLYRFHSFQGKYDSQTVIKPQKQIKRILYFEFPNDVTPKELFIENRRFPIRVE